MKNLFIITAACLTFAFLFHVRAMPLTSSIQVQSEQIGSKGMNPNSDFAATELETNVASKKYLQSNIDGLSKASKPKKKMTKGA